MASRGFGAGGPGWSPDGSATFLYCTGAQSFASQWPVVVDLVRARCELPLDDPRACLDLEVEISDGGTLVRFDLESVELDGLMRGVGLDHLARRCSIDVLRGLGPSEAGKRLRTAVETLLPLGRER